MTTLLTTAALVWVGFAIVCARCQRSTQFCAEVVERDKIITELLKMLKPGPELISCAQVDFQASFELEVTGNFYDRACEIAGRTE